MLYESRIETLFYRVQHPPRASAVMLVALLSSMLCWGCVTVAEHRKLERRVIDAKRTQGGSPARQALAELDAELDDLRGQIRELAGKLEETQRIALRSLEEARRARREAAATAGRVGGRRGCRGGPGRRRRHVVRGDQVLPGRDRRVAEPGLSQLY